MNRSPSFFRSITWLAALSPVLLLPTSGCGDDAALDVDPTQRDGGPGADGGPRSDSGPGGSGTADTTKPTVVSTQPVEGAAGTSTNPAVTADFSEAMAAPTINGSSFTVKEGAIAVPGVVSYFDGTASFVPTSPLGLAKTYTATLTADVTDAAGNALAGAYSWSFTTDATAPAGPAPVSLGAAGKFVVLGKSAIVNVPTSTVTGNVGLSPAAASYITGFGLTKAGTKWTSPQVVGGIFAADNDPPTPSNLTTAVASMETAYTDAAGRPTPTFLDLGGGALGGLELAPGLYKWASNVTIPADVTIKGGANDTWIFQISGNLAMSAAKRMTLAGGARARNIVWQVAGAVDFGTTSHAEGIVLSQTAITLQTGASINGRLLAQTAVSIAGSAVTAPAP